MTRDFGDAVLMPGLVNAHTHLEYTLLRGFLEDVPFFPWIRALTALKSQLTTDEWHVSASLGAAECLASGITAIGDNADAGVTAGVAANAGLRGVIYQEVFGIDNRQSVGEIISALALKVDANRSAGGSRIAVGVSPHASYTVRPELFRALTEWTAERNLPLSIHVAESDAESALIERGEGPFAQMFKDRAIEWQTPHLSPTGYVAGFDALGPGTLAIHCVHQSPEDIALIAASGASIVHCPKSNAKLGAGIAPLTDWLRCDALNVAIGTDSAVSNNTHDLFEEMRFALLMQRAQTHDVTAVTAEQMLRMATIGGAKALGIDSLVGTLTPGKRADIVAVDIAGAHAVPVTDPYGALLYSTRPSDVTATIVDGEILYDQGHWTTLDVETIKADAIAIRARLLQ